MRFELIEGDRVSEQLDLSNEVVEVINAGGAGEFVPDRMRGETAEEYEERKAMLATLLSGGGN